MKLRVAATTQINHGGQLYRAGKSFEVADQDGQARIWLARGWVERIDAPPAPAEPEPEPRQDEAGDKPDPEPEPVSQVEPIADADLDAASRDALREEAGRLGIAKSGNKDELLERIRAARAG